MKSKKRDQNIRAYRDERNKINTEEIKKIPKNSGRKPRNIWVISEQIAGKKI